MPYPTGGNMGQHFADLAELEKAQQEIRDSAREILDQIKPALIGQHVRQYGRLWQICQVDVRACAVVTCYGVTVSKTGKVGTRGFDLGMLSDCEFVNMKESPGG